jgi:hypothetical protein
MLLLIVAGCGGHERHFVSHPPPATPWRSVINDWYDGRIDQPHSCGAVRTAIRHLPASPDTTSTAKQDLEAYAKTVC